MISALGQCPTHHIDLMSVTSMDGNEQRICVKCRAAAEPKSGRVQVVEDPGEGFNGFVGGKGKVTILKDVPTTTSNKTAPVVNLGERNTLEDYISQALNILSHAPMPNDLKQFKQIQKVTSILKGLLENQNG